MLLFLAGSCTLILDEEIADKVGSGSADETGCVLERFWLDADADGHGTGASVAEACELPTGYADNADDCDDDAAGINPDAEETCDGRDNDCDGTVDQSAVDALIWYQDLDLDIVGNDAVSVAACTAPEGYVTTGGDCDDLNSSVTYGETWFIDNDGDEWGDEPVVACEQPVGSVLLEGDCDDGDGTIHPEAAEFCNGLDDDCDTEADEEATDMLTWYADHDEDGYGTDDETTLACTPPAGFVELATDCDDTSASFSPGATETCSGLDEDCDDLIDADDPDMVGVATWYLDADSDGHGVPTTTMAACTRPDGYALAADDCDDVDGTVFPGADETCDGTDEDCDGSLDEAAIDAVIWYADADSDSYGDPTNSLTQCEQPAGYVDNSDDCDDSDWDVSPEGVEMCDGTDQDCDGAIDEQIWYADSDGDGFGDASAPDTTCVMPSGFVADSSDCDDSKGDVSPNGIEVCDSGTTDEDCDGFADDADAGVIGQFAWYGDGDSDGWGVGAAAMACVAPVGTVGTEGDCDDSDGSISPDGIEVCGGADEDCDTLTDDDDPDVLGVLVWFLDDDGDHYGTAATTTEACLEPIGYAPTDDDCDDGDDTVSPIGVEICDDATDQDCDGADSVCPVFEDYTTDWGSEMIAISAGSFTMGGGAGDPTGSYTDHVVTLTHDFWIGQTEITHSQWENFPENASWTYSGRACTTSTTTAVCPADRIAWIDVAKYANALSAQEGLMECYLADGSDVAVAYSTDPYSCPGYRMPTEAEWEYAARAGQNTEFSGSNTAASVAWYYANAFSLGTYAHRVATLAPNAWGLYDMSGNVWEWTNDWYSGTYGGYSGGAAQTDPPGPTSGSYRVGRGDSWANDAAYVRVTSRDYANQYYGTEYTGARLSRSVP